MENSNKKYFVSHNDKQSGPFSISDILNRIESGELNIVDYIYDDSCEDWVTLLEFQPLSSQLKNQKPSSAPNKSNDSVQSGDDYEESQTETIKIESSNSKKPIDGHQWHVLKGDNKFGPFSYLDVIRMLQEKVLFEFDFAWHSGLDSWVRIAELDAFNSDEIKKLQGTLMPDISEVFFRRKYKRVSYNGTILIHDNKSIWKGKGIEISAGGAGIVMENAMVVPGQTLYLHFKPGDGVPPFNAICEVVSKKYEEGVKDKSESVRYGVKFKSLNPNTQRAILEFSKDESTPAA